jgi:hypothetical protein
MNDQSSGWSPDFNEDDERDDGPLRSEVERSLMDRARRAAERDRERGPRRYVQHAIALVAALCLVAAIAMGFDTFITAMQRIMRMTGDEDKRPVPAQPARPPDPTEPMPAYVVPPE